MAPGRLAGTGGSARVRMGTLRAINLRLTTMRRQLGPQRGIFERIGEEIGQALRWAMETLAADLRRRNEAAATAKTEPASTRGEGGYDAT